MEKLMKNGQQGLYNPDHEHDACGIGLVANIKGRKSHQNISDALTILENLEHRGACGCEDNTGDGAGISFQVPHEFLVSECVKIGIRLPEAGYYGVGMVFFPKGKDFNEECKEIFGSAAEQLGLDILGYRKVPVNRHDIGDTALSVEPEIEQVFVKRPESMVTAIEFERKLFVLRNYASHTINSTIRKNETGFYIASLSAATIIYKGQLTSNQVRRYFPDLQNKRLTSAYALVHSRFATNTFPSWALAQPFRYIAHNGEINTLQGNLNWLRTNEQRFASPHFTREEFDMLLPLVPGKQSDSASLDNMVEMLMLSGRSLPHVLMMLVPEAWDGNEALDSVQKAFYEYHSCLMEPWDGPAAICFSDGKTIGATLDRNGLRPIRYSITADGRMILASETGVLGLHASQVVKKGRLRPGKMLVIDLEQGKIIFNDELKKEICSQQPYAEWLEKYKITLGKVPEPRTTFTALAHDQVFKYQKAFGYTTEAIEDIIMPMALSGKEPVGSMGTDTPLAVLSKEPQHLSSYFKQLFAQVTNPPIDPIREKLVMSLASFAGTSGNILEEDPLAAHCIVLRHPILDNYYLEKIRSVDTGTFQSKTIQCYFRADGSPDALKKALDRVCRYAVDAVEDGYRMLILQDRAIDSRHAPIPSLLSASAVHHHLIRKGLRGEVGIIVEAGDVWEVQHAACLIAFGATAINPYMAFATIRDRIAEELSDTSLSVDELKDNYIAALNGGLLKVFSKMGISTFQSYQGAQIFEILGLNREVVNQYFTGATSNIEGLGLDDIAEEALIKHRFAFSTKQIPSDRLPVGGELQWKRKGEFHLFNPQTIHLLQLSTRTNDYDLFKKYSKLVNEQGEKACTLRSLLTFDKKQKSISIDEVEPAENIYRRFSTGAMSFGSISWEAHTTLALGMNKLGAKSNTGEGGEDEARYEIAEDGSSMRSSIKQVASGRFGVTSRYLTEADELQIKMAQGAKPGEGGQLPGEKVDDWIGRTRHATPGVGLISPPPHHDIYSIEDLAQLIFDLKNANRKARISVKLVSKAGVGTIASGVTKAKADVVLVSGFDGGTGASPLSSVKHAGLPWELGLAETHQTLIKNKLRSRVVVQADGQMKTGRDIAIAALLGAEEWGVATAALVVEGCVLMRKCHLNTCPVGVATQDKELRNRFTGEVDHVVNLFKFITEELREIMAELGFRTIDEMIGQSDNLKQRDDIEFWKHKNIDLSRVLYKEPNPDNVSLFCTEEQDHGLSDILDWQLLEKAQPALQNGQKVEAVFKIKNTDRAVGTLLSNEITKLYKSDGLPQDTLNFQFYGAAGQSFGAFATKGLTMRVEGDANDYFGKGLSGAKLVICPPQNAGFKPEANSVVGNVVLYGATSGEAYIYGRAGERFAVRNSGATVVVEGIGDHGCEYMTGGRVVVLGKIGRNFGAGMSGGIAFIYDVYKDFAERCNPEMIDLEQCNDADREELFGLLQKHLEYTGSATANFILKDFDNQLDNFVKVFPKDYKKALQRLEEAKKEY
ncbi:glutamate synthase large subunit [Flavobacterium sp. Sd200]|uniref:glutamate synthase large subunit n=1 Tax=Flavobacterium sp. Sd200 TaxID=2692211 RepID=UPI001369C0B9|nr:glutamate synthase large subunit [Flavobacterium sp. Sd200]MXN92234.1 glutamate synthase large subunit [Flavobacterium sp. Sd200]